MMKFDHIGIFVKSLEIGREHLNQIYYINKWSKICYELVATKGKNNPVDRVLNDGKNILNHLAYKVENIEKEIERLKNKRCILISGPNPATAFKNKKIAFFYTPLRFIIEIIEL